MKLSIVIVNYNVKFFLEQCLQSIISSTTKFKFEIICVDNNSVDGSIRMLQEKFKHVNLISNNHNVGFAKACNQGIKIAKGEYILILNPDTLLEEDTLEKALVFMDANPTAGGLGVKLIDGKGKYLPESKRGIPTPTAAFYKMSGLAKFFYPSKIFGKYHLDHLSNNETHEVEILTGAFMLLRKSILEKVGLFDEDFFMYGEDIDLSYRIIKSGYKNYYFPETQIIHYKGESTKKSSIKYVFSFYKAMLIFANKHFSKRSVSIFSLLLNFAIYFRAGLSVVNRLLNKIILPLFDVSILFFGLILIKNIWESKIIFVDGGNYPSILIYLVVPVYILIWILSLYFSGFYDKPYKQKHLVSGFLIGTILILIGYSMLDESWRFSRALILLGAAWGIIIISGFRYILSWLKLIQFDDPMNKRRLIVGNLKEAKRVMDILQSPDQDASFIGLIKPENSPINNQDFIGNISQLKDIVQIFNIDEVIFCSLDVGSNQIITKMGELYHKEIIFKIAPEKSISIIGSNSIISNENLYLYEINAISSVKNIRTKRLVDLLMVLILTILIPLNIFIIKNFFGFLKNLTQVLINKKTWVGYHQTLSNQNLPKIKSSILTITDGIQMINTSDEKNTDLNQRYARNYRIFNDLNTIWRGYKKLGEL